MKILNSLFSMTLLPTNTTERYYLIARVLQSLENIMSKTADTLGISFNTVKTVAKWVENGMPHKKQPGRPKILTESMKYYICVNTIYNPEIS